MEDFEKMVNDHHQEVQNKEVQNGNFNRKADQEKRTTKVAENNKNKSLKILATTLAGVVITTGVVAVGVIQKDWKNNTNYCNLTNQETTDLVEFVTTGPKTKTVYVELYGDTYTFGSFDEGLELKKAAILNEYETSGVDKPEEFVEDNYENYLVFVGEKRENNEKIDGGEYIDYVIEEKSKGAR